jgi:hypothetical protein
MSEPANADLHVSAQRFATALDNDDYATAASMLAADCVYETGSGQVRGAQAICNSYREASVWGRQNLDSLSYESQVGPLVEGEVAVVFTDHIEHKGASHTYQCKQVLHFDASGSVERIQNVDLPGQREALTAFFASVGVARRGG